MIPTKITVPYLALLNHFKHITQTGENDTFLNIIADKLNM